MLTPPPLLYAIPHAHGQFGTWDELLCFAALLVIALAVFVVYGRDLLKPPPPGKEAENTPEAKGREL